MKKRNGIDYTSTLPFLCFYVCLCLFADLAMAREDASAKTSKFMNEVVIPSAESICGKVSSTGGNASVEGKVEITASLKNILRYIADPKIQGSAKGLVSAYTGVLQEHLSQSLKDNQNCKIEIAKILTDFALAKSTSESTKPTSIIVKQTQVVVGKEEHALPSEECSNGVYVYYNPASLHEGTRSQEVWSCSSLRSDMVVANKAGLSAADLKTLDKYRGRVSLSNVTTAWRWGDFRDDVVSVLVKNVGDVSVQVHSVEVLKQASERPLTLTPDFPKKYVIFPGDEVWVPVSNFDSLAGFLGFTYSPEDSLFLVSDTNGDGCKFVDEVRGKCEHSARGFGISISFTDIFNWKNQYSKVFFLRQEKWDVQ